MRIFPSEIEIEESEGFTPAKDIFGRKELGEGLTSLISAVQHPMVIALDSPWGSGKTIFLKMWAGELRKSGFPVVFFDAFEHDHMDDAFAAIAGQIVALVEELSKGDQPASQRFITKAVNVGKVLARSGVKVAVKAVTIGVVDGTEMEKLGAAIAGEAGELTDKHIGEMITKQNEKKEILRAFRDALTELPSLLTGSFAGADDEERSAPKPLVFIVDELDRCRPSFALEVLERIKHFFSVPNVHFVLGTHLAQLHNSVLISYGPGVDAQTYLQKFIHVTTAFTEDSRSPRTRTAAKFIEHLVNALQFSSRDRETVGTAMEFIRFVAIREDLSLRAIERILSVLALALASSRSTDLRPPVILAGLCVLKVTSPEVFKKCKQGSATFDDIAKPLCLTPRGGESEDDLEEISYTARWWKWCTNASGEGDEFPNAQQLRWDYNIREPRRIIPIVANSILDRFRIAQ